MADPLTLGLIITSCVGIITLVIKMIFKRIHKSTCGKKGLEIDFCEPIICPHCKRLIEAKN